MIMVSNSFAGAKMISGALKLPVPVDVSLDAALELEEVLQGLRDTAPAFQSLVSILKAPRSSMAGSGALSMLSDVRSSDLVKNAHPDVAKGKQIDRDQFARLITVYFDELLEGIAAKDRNRVAEAKRFCLSLNHQLIIKSHGDLVSRHARRQNAQIMDVD